MGIFGGFSILNMKEMYDIHIAAMKIIKETGLEILNDELLDIAYDAGINVNKKKKRVYITEESVLETIRQKSGADTYEITEHGTNKTRLHKCIASKIDTQIGSNTGFIINSDCFKMIPVTNEIIKDFIKLKRFLGCTEHGPGLIPQNVPPEISPIHATAVNAKYGKGLGVPDCKDIKDMEWITRVMQASGKWEKEQKFFTYALVKSPLCLVGRDADIVLYGVKHGLLTRIAGVPMYGATSPCTLAGDLALRFAENWGFMTFSRLITPPPNNKFKPGGFNSDPVEIDLRSGRQVNGSPRIGLIRIAWTQMQGEFYKLPEAAGNGIDFFTDAMEPGIQATAEKCLSAIATLSRGVYKSDNEPFTTIAGLGSLASNLCLSMEQAIIDNEIVKYLNKFLEGIKVNKDTIGLDAILEASPSGDFLSSDHTLEHFREVSWFPELFFRGAYDTWIASGKKGPLEIAKEKVYEAKKMELPLSINIENAKEVDRIVEEAEKALLGKTTGIRL